MHPRSPSQPTAFTYYYFVTRHVDAVRTDVNNGYKPVTTLTQTVWYHRCQLEQADNFLVANVTYFGDMISFFDEISTELLDIIEAAINIPDAVRLRLPGPRPSMSAHSDSNTHASQAKDMHFYLASTLRSRAVLDERTQVLRRQRLLDAPRKWRHVRSGWHLRGRHRGMCLLGDHRVIDSRASCLASGRHNERRIERRCHAPERLVVRRVVRPARTLDST